VSLKGFVHFIKFLKITGIVFKNIPVILLMFIGFLEIFLLSQNSCLCFYHLILFSMAKGFLILLFVLKK
jgi:hypothetical protein